MAKNKHKKLHNIEVQRPEEEKTEVHHIRLYLRVGMALEQEAVLASRRVPDYMRVVLEEHLEDLEEADRREKLMSKGEERNVIRKELLFHGVDANWRKGEDRRMYHVRMLPALRIALKQRAAQANRSFPEFVRLVLEKRVEGFYEMTKTGEPTNEAVSGKRGSVQTKPESGIGDQERRVFHFSLPVTLGHALKKRAAEERRRIPEYVRLILEKHLEDIERADKEGESNQASSAGMPNRILLPEEFESLRRMVEPAVRHAEEAARDARATFSQSFTYLVAAHDGEKIGKTDPGMSPSRCAEPTYQSVGWGMC